ncbi:MAG: hypothetical protein MZW92_62690 [Comamonadaceae bacterium]|nr:hypothetical protein [Comamonadaceae bacterium]
MANGPARTGRCRRPGGDAARHLDAAPAVAAGRRRRGRRERGAILGGRAAVAAVGAAP